jgi:hypothetical protein
MAYKPLSSENSPRTDGQDDQASAEHRYPRERAADIAQHLAHAEEVDRREGQAGGDRS